MNILCEIQFPTTIEYYALERSDYNSIQWQTGYLTRVSSIVFGLGDDKSYQAIRASLLFNDLNEILKNKFSETYNKDMPGSKVILRTGTGSLLATLNLQYGKPLPGKQFQIEISDRNGEMTTAFTERITLEEFPSCVQSAFDEGAIKPIVFGSVSPNESGTLKIYQVLANSYLISDNQDETVTIISAFLEDGTVITGSCAVSTPADGKTYITYSATNPDKIYVNVNRGSYKNGDPQDVLEQILEIYGGYSNPNYTNKATLTTFLDNIYSTYFRNYSIMEDYNLAQVRKDFAETYNLDTITNSDGETEVKWIDLNDLTVPELKHFQEGTFKSFKLQPDPDYFTNRIRSRAKYDYRDKVYLKEFLYENKSSQAKFGIKDGEINGKFQKSDEPTVFSAKYRSVFDQYPREKIVAEFLNINHFIDRGVELGDLIKIKHSDAKTNDWRLYQVRKVQADYQNDKMVITCYDYTFLENIDIAGYLLSRGSGGNLYGDHFDYSINTEKGNHILNPALSIANSNTEVLFFNSSIWCWGFRRITTADKNEWDVFGSLSGDFTINFYYNPISFAGTYAIKFPVFMHYQDADNFWTLQFEATGQLRLVVRVGGVNQVDITSTAVFTTGSFQTGSMIKKGSDVGIYMAGTQENYVSLGSTYNFTGSLYMYGNNALGRYLWGYIGESYIRPDNVLGGNPVVGITDSFNPWWHPMNEKAERVVLACFNPRVNDQWNRGKIHRIKWNIPNIWVQVDLYDNAGTPVFVKTLSASVGNREYYDWNISGSETIAERRIKITSLDGNISAFSELFDIIA